MKTFWGHNVFGVGKGWIIALGFCWILAVGGADFLVPHPFSFDALYFLPVFLVSWAAGRSGGLPISVLAALVWTFCDLGNHELSRLGAILWNGLSRLAILLSVALLVSYVRGVQGHLNSAIAERTRQLQQELARSSAIQKELAAARQREQRRIAGELHDGLGQVLGSLAFQAKLLAGRLNGTDPALAREAEALVKALNQSVAQTRALSHLLDPVGAESGGLFCGLSRLVDDCGRAFGVDCTWEAPKELPALPPETELQLYRIAQESIHNAARHGKPSRVAVRASCENGALKLTVTDNGGGFQLGAPVNGWEPGIGLALMRYRAGAIGGQLELQSSPGQGCRVSCTVPLPAQALAGSSQN